jgi:hypothetical protein
MDRNSRIAGLSYYALAGLSAGLALAIAAGQWTWLEMRCNIGILTPLATLAGGVTGYVRGKVEPLTAPLCLLALILAVLVVTGGDPSAAAIIVGATLREGFGIPDMPLVLTNRLALLLALLLALVSLTAFVRRPGRRGGEDRH